jgi:hypothetical protein
MLLKLELDSNYSLQAIVLMLLQFLGNQTKHLKLWEVWMPTSKFDSLLCYHECTNQEISAGDRMQIGNTVVTNTLQNTPREKSQSLGFLQKRNPP